MPSSMRTDVHQHLLPEDLIAALSRRTRAPRIANGMLHVAGEPPSPFDAADHDPHQRGGLDDLDRIVIALSSALGIETLPAEEAEPLIDAFNRGILELGEPFDLWGAVSLDAPRASDVDDLLDHGALGISLPATALADRRGLRHVAPLLDRLEARGGPAEAIHDPLAWFDVSSYGPRALDGMIRAIGIDRLLFGSDRPVAAPPAAAALGDAVVHALAVTNPEWAFSGRATVAVLA
jgi:hypothetical protein